jgi:multidrug resistance efflux pump
MKRYISLAIFGITSIATLPGCDQVREAVMGQPDPNAPTIQAVGPSGMDDSTQVANKPPVLTPQAWNTTPNTSAVEVAGSQEGIQPVPNTVVQSGGPSFNDSLFQQSPGPSSIPATPNYTSTDVNSGLAVPSAEAAISPSMSGAIVVKSAFLQFRNELDIEVAAPADGLITEMDVEEGGMITKGSLIFQLDDRLPRSELAVTMKEHEAAVEKAGDKSEIEYSKASVEVAEQDFKVTKLLVEKEASTDMELSKKWLEYKRAALGVTVAEVKNRQDVSAVGVAEAKKGAAQVQIELRRIVSPFEGIVAEKKKEKHDWVRAGEIIMRLIAMEQLKVVGQVNVNQLSKAPHELVNAPASVKIEVFPGRIEQVETKVGYVSPVMQSSGGYKIWVQIPNKQSNGQWVYREGMPATIEISTR